MALLQTKQGDGSPATPFQNCWVAVLKTELGN